MYTLVQLTFATLIGISAHWEAPVSTAHTTNEKAEIGYRQTTPTVKQITAKDVAPIRKEQQAIMIDVRTPEELKNGVIAGTEVFINFYGGNFEEEISKLDRSKAYIVYCASGNRSGKAANLMLNKGFTNVYNLQGGISQWPEKTVKKP